MSRVNYMILKDSLIVNFDGKTSSVNRGDRRYNTILLAIKENRLDEIPDLMDISPKLNRSGFEVVHGSILKDGVELPKALSDRIIAFLNDGLPFEPLLNLWEKLSKNPSFNSRQMLYKFLEHNGHPITQDGCFIAYRGVTEDFKDVHTKTFDNNVGSVCSMDRSMVDDNPDNTCSSGLHVACYSYANGFGPKTVEVKVDPVDVVCVPRDYDGTKMRVCKFEVMNVVQTENSELLYGHQRIEQDDLFDDCDDYGDEEIGDDEFDEYF